MVYAVDEMDEEDCFCVCNVRVSDELENCPHDNLHYCNCCGKVYCMDCGCKWGCSKCAGAIECSTEGEYDV